MKDISEDYCDICKAEIESCECGQYVNKCQLCGEFLQENERVICTNCEKEENLRD